MGGGMGGGVGGGMSGSMGGGAGVVGGAGQSMCSVHNRRRTMQNLVDDGMGGFCCTPQTQCRVDGAPGAAPENMRNGDWLCPKCGDHQFARNSMCRKCGAEKPMQDLTGFLSAPADSARAAPY